MSRRLSAQEIMALAPAGAAFGGTDRRQPLRDALRRWGQDGPGQTAGRFWPIACVALEITQRCNLDCSLCYLSDAAEAAHDVPLPILVRRLRMIESHYGPATSIQISGGDPTLRRAEDLEALCREIRALGMRSCLMTNGIRATRKLLTRLAAAGLDDVAFHVDLTQERPGYPDEAALDVLRAEYIARARGLGLRVLFNTTVFDGNLAELPRIARFFREHAREVTLASFQLQSATGRGRLRERGAPLTRERVMLALAEGMGTPLDFDVALVGHERCNRYAAVLVAGDRAVSALVDRALFHDLVAGLEAAERPGRDTLTFRPAAIRLALRRPGLALRALRHGLGLLWRLRGGLCASGGRVHRLALLVHDFMDAAALERDRCESCVFMIATEHGPISMCAHNAARDRHLFAPARVDAPDGPRWWSAATGRETPHPDAAPPGPLPRKKLKGRNAANLWQTGRAIHF